MVYPDTEKCFDSYDILHSTVIGRIMFRVLQICNLGVVYMIGMNGYRPRSQFRNINVTGHRCYIEGEETVVPLVGVVQFFVKVDFHWYYSRAV